MHSLGIHGNYAIPDQLQNVVSGYGLRIEQLDDDRYQIQNAEQKDVSVDTLCPDFIQRDGDVFDLANLRKFSEFLQQPIRSTLDDALPKSDVSGFRARSKQRKLHEADVHEQRTDIHRLLRFAVTGSVEIPPDEEEGLDKETAECHAQTEQAMRDEDTWRNEVEFGNSEVAISSIPNTELDVVGGFRLKLSPDVAELQGLHQKALDGLFWQSVHEVTGGRYAEQQPSEITLSGSEIAELSQTIDREKLKELIDAVEFEEAVQEKLEAVQKRLVNDVVSPDRVVGTGAEEEKLKKLMDSSSALSPVLGSKYMSDAWARYNFTERHESPLESVQKEIGVFTTVLDLLRQNGDVTQGQAEAVVGEFYSLIAFSKMAMEAIEDGLAKQAHYEKGQNGATLGALSVAASHREAFREASHGGVDLNAAFLSEEQRDSLTTLCKWAGKKRTVKERVKSAAMAPLSAAGDTAVDFTTDVVNFIREDPKIAIAYMGLAAKVVSMNGGNDMVQQREQSYQQALEFGDDGEFVDVGVNAENVPTDLFVEQGYHWDLRITLDGYEMYKHFANSNFIVTPTQKFMEGIRSTVHGAYTEMGIPVNYDSSFDNTANAVVNPLAEHLFAVNMFQNFSHVAFWMWSFSKGWNNGLKGAERIFELGGAINDVVYQAGASVGDNFKQSTKLSDALAGLKDVPLAQYKYDAEVGVPELMDEMVQAAEQREELIVQLPEGAALAPGALSIDGMGKGAKGFDSLKREFTIHAGNYAPTLEAIHKFDSFMSHTASGVLAKEKWHVEPLVKSLKSVRNALEEYSRTQDVQVLNRVLDDNLEYVLASEMRYRGGRSEIYQALFEATPDKEAFKRLMRSANTTIGQERRKDKKANIRSEIRGEGEEPLKLTGHIGARAKLVGTDIWGSVVSTAKFIRRGTDRVINKRNVILASTVAVGSSLMDLAGVSTPFTDTVSGLTGGAIASTATLATFINFNFWEDIVGVHIGTGLALLGTGAATGVAYRRGVKPALLSALETQSGETVRKVWSSVVSEPLKYGMDVVGGALDKKNTEWGEAMTRRAVLRFDEGPAL